MTRPVELTRDEAEMLVDLCEHTCDGRLWGVAAELRGIWGMRPQRNDERGKPIPDGDLGYVGLPSK